MLAKVIFLVPVLIVLLMLIQLLVKNIDENKVLRADGKRVFFFKPDTAMGKAKDSFVLWYKTKLLDYSPNMTFPKIVRIKLVMLSIAMALTVAVQLTNIQIYSQDVMSIFDYRTNVLSDRTHIKDTDKELESEIKLLNAALPELNANKLKERPKEQVLRDLRYYIEDKELSFDQPIDVVIDKVYNRLSDYFAYREFSYFSVILFGLIAFLLLDGLLLLRKVFVNASRKKELRFLKRLVVLNGNIKPVDFLSVLKTMMDRSVYHRTILNEIYNANQNNKINMKTVYRKFISKEKDLDTKLFYEKLDQANNHDFDQAVKNIKNDFAVERRQRSREVRKRVEMIHTVAVAGLITLIAVVLVYLLLPWMQAYNIQDLIS